jgi:hypothetical protein
VTTSHKSAANKRNPESGYVLLLVFAMAAILAITLYTQVPRAAFEAQRDKEQLLMDRGHQYIRAVTLFVHNFNRFPGSMDELENTNGKRFLRRRYVDPMTGKADWRLLHAGPGGVITDSILTTKKADASSVNNFITELGPMTGAAPVGDPDGVNLATRRRASDQPGAPGDAISGGGGDPSSSSGTSGYNGPVMVLPNGTIVPANSTGTVPAGPVQGINMPGIPGAVGFSGAPLPTGVAIQQNTLNGQNTPPIPTQFGPPSGASNLINQILTSPRPGGQFGSAGGQGVTAQGTPLTTSAPATGTNGTPAGQQVIGAGLAGVASKREQEGIKTYNDQTKYNKWEFVYDVTKDPSKVGQARPAGAAAATGGQGLLNGPGLSSSSSTSTSANSTTVPTAPATTPQ